MVDTIIKLFAHHDTGSNQKSTDNAKYNGHYITFLIKETFRSCSDNRNGQRMRDHRCPSNKDTEENTRARVVR